MESWRAAGLECWRAGWRVGGVAGLQAWTVGGLEDWRVEAGGMFDIYTDPEPISKFHMWELPELEFFRVEPNSCPFLIESIRRSSQVISMDQ